MNGWFQPQRFTRTLCTTEIFGSCSLNALDWNIASDANKPFLQRYSAQPAEARLFLDPSIHRARFHCGLWNCIMTCLELQRCIAFIITTSALLRTYQQRGRVNIYYRTVLLLPLSNNQTNNSRQELSYRNKIRLRYINTAGKRAKYPASKNNTRVEIRQYSRVWMRRSAPQYRFKGPPSAIGIKLRAHL